MNKLQENDFFYSVHNSNFSLKLQKITNNKELNDSKNLLWHA